MRIRTIGLLALVVLAALVCVTAAGWVLLAAQGERASAQELAVELSTIEQRAVYASSLRTLARDTAEQRAVFSELVSGTNAVEIVQQFESAGAAAGVEVSVDAVQPAQLPARGNTTVSALALLVRAEGPFAQVMHLLQLIQALPTVTTVDSYTLERADEGDVWSATVRARVLTDRTEL